MINVEINADFKTGKVEVRGPKAIVMAEFTALAKDLRETLAKKHGLEKADADISDCIAKSKMTLEEIDAENERLERELLERFRGFLFGGIC